MGLSRSEFNSLENKLRKIQRLQQEGEIRQ
jgi:hypothetical protein